MSRGTPVMDSTKTRSKSFNACLKTSKFSHLSSIKTENGEAGQIYKLRPEDFTNIVHFAASLHDTNLATTIEIGKKLLAEQMPNEIVIFAVEVEEVIKFSEEMTERVRETIPKVANLVLGEIGST